MEGKGEGRGEEWGRKGRAVNLSVKSCQVSSTVEHLLDILKFCCLCNTCKRRHLLRHQWRSITHGNFHFVEA